jgi:hypothetical protein
MSSKKGKEKQGLIEIVALAALDQDFRKQLLSDPTTIAKLNNLSTLDALALKHITSEQLDEAAKGLSLRADWWIGIGIHASFSVEGDSKP